MLQQKLVDLFARGSSVSLPVAERDVVLTYVLRILADAGLLEHLIFKGGTCVRKVFLGRSGRFSEDLDFTAIDISDPDDLILAIAEVFDSQTCHDITLLLLSLSQAGCSWAPSPRPRGRRQREYLALSGCSPHGTPPRRGLGAAAE